MNSNNKSSQCYHINITNSIFNNIFSQQFPNLFSDKNLEETHDVVKIFSSNSCNSESKNTANENFKKNSSNFKKFGLDDEKIGSIRKVFEDEFNKNIHRNDSIKSNFSLFNKCNNIKNENNSNVDKEINHTYYDNNKKPIQLNGKLINSLVDDSHNNENKLYNNDDNLLSDHNNNINTEDNIPSEEIRNEIINIDNGIPNIISNNNRHHKINYHYDYLSNPFYYYLTKFNYLLSQWKINSKIDSRYEGFLDEIIIDIMNKKYKIPLNITKRYIIDFSRIVGSGSNGRIFYAVDNITGKEVALKITLSVYGSSYEEHMLKYCNSEHTVNLIESYNDHVITIIVIDLFGTIWSPENEIISPLTHEGLDYNYYKENNIIKEKRINLRDLYACAKIHKYFPDCVIKKIMKQLIFSIYHFHSNLGVTHGDIKLQNILVDQDYTIKVTDFSAMRFIKNGKIKNFSGARMFAAPEALKGNFDGRLNDIWALGVIFYKLLFGVNKKIDFDKDNSILIESMININEDAIDLLKLLLTYDHTKRPMIESIISHPYII